MNELRERFLKAYANIPISLRDQLILLLDQKFKALGKEVKVPLTWHVAFLEVKENSDLSQKILQELATLDLI